VKETFLDLRDRAAVEVIQKSTAALGLTHSPVATERTTVYRNLDALARYAAGDALPRALAVLALAELASWRAHSRNLDRLALAAECRAALDEGRPVTIAQLGAFTHRGRTQVFSALQRQQAARIGRRIGARSARAVVATFRTADTFSAGSRRTKKGQAKMMLQHQSVPKEGESPRLRSKAKTPRRREPCSPPRRISAQPPNGRTRLNGRKARPVKGGAS
jgi:hypothetical protein